MDQDDSKIGIADRIESESQQEMTKLARKFPCLANAPGISPWDADELDRWAARVASHGERVTARFVLAVWNPHHQWASGRFDLMEALRVWTPPHHQAFLEWAVVPFWP